MTNAANINPVYFLSPLIPIIFSFFLIFYWRRKKSFKWVILAYALVAYAGAILIKAVFQSFTAGQIVSTFGSVSVVTGLYYGLQTSILEVGLAYLLIIYALKRGSYEVKDAGSYGISLSFWENGVLLGIFPLISILSSYLAISFGSPSVSKTVLDSLQTAQPSLFYPLSKALPLVGLSGIERVSSLLVHYSWGLLVFLAAFAKKPRYFLIALPMGLIDALVPFANYIGIVLFEGIIFAIAVGLFLLSVMIASNFIAKSQKLSTQQ